MLQYLDSINTEPWTHQEVCDLWIMALCEGTVGTCDWMHTRFGVAALDNWVEPWFSYIYTRVPECNLQWAIEHGITALQLAGYAGRPRSCGGLSGQVSCAAFHWAHENGLPCTCAEDDEGYEDHESFHTDAVFERRPYYLKRSAAVRACIKSRA